MRKGRFVQALGRQDWMAVAIEVLVVVLGILIALQVDQWADDRRERALERTYLLRLKEDLQIEMARADDAEGWARNRLAAVGLLAKIASSPSAAAENPGKVPWAIETATWRSFPKLSAFVYDELQNTGQMRLIRSVALRRELADHYGNIAREAEVGEDRYAEQVYDVETAGLLKMDELEGVERGADEERGIRIDAGRAIVLARDFSSRDEAVRQLPSVAQHHLFNLKAIGAMKKRIRSLMKTVDEELAKSA